MALSAFKRKHDVPPGFEIDRIVIDILSDEEDVTIVPPPPKRHKSATPVLDGGSRPQSRDGSRDSNSTLASVSKLISPSPARALGFQKPTVPPPLPKQRLSTSHQNLFRPREKIHSSVHALSPATTTNGAVRTNSFNGYRKSENTKPSPSHSTSVASPSNGSGGRFLSSVNLPTRQTSVPQPVLKTIDKFQVAPKPLGRPRLVQHSTPPPKLKAPSQPPTPLQANIELVIENTLRQWTGPPPKSAATLNAERKAERKALLKDLKVSTEVAKKRPDDVERHFGQTGFSKAFSTEITENELALRTRLASQKKKKQSVTAVDRHLDIDSELAKSLDNLIISDKSSIITPEQSTRVLLTNRFNEEVNPPLSFANNVNEKLLHGKFQFTDRYILRPGIKEAALNTNFGCTCGGECGLDSCQCFTRTATDVTSKKPISIGQRQTYFRRPDGIIVLTNNYIAQELQDEVQHFEITECNDCCSCGDDCTNKVVSKGRTVPLEIFQTAKCGFGVRSSVDIVKGQFIELYLGEVITETELERREQAADEGSPSYIYSLDWFTGVDNRCYHVDGEIFGTAMRFVNHCCAPNARCFTVTTHKRDEKLYYLAFFAIENIPAGVEIRIDYHGGGRKLVGEDGLPVSSQEKGDPTSDDPELVPCYCGAKKCRKILWNPTKQKRAGRRSKRHE
ncbi:hypothetical protein LTR84_006503 [Exophiala bonariae]|uniref:SET domain-containing protein n=1 Tax=Exophiala bonariae TaxID=1690606 RepID=A0AAV9N236_9EURO|nr:hypothetical protein LTR84_006503 [Exophiala bonariae]